MQRANAWRSFFGCSLQNILAEFLAVRSHADQKILHGIVGAALHQKLSDLPYYIVNSKTLYEIKSLCVILSEGGTPKPNFCGVRNERSKSAKGGISFGILLSCHMFVTFRIIKSNIPHEKIAVTVRRSLPHSASSVRRFWIGSQTRCVSLSLQNFGFKNRFAIFFAQDDTFG